MVATLAERAEKWDGGEPLAVLVEEFYGPDGPLAAAGWRIRPQQVSMSLDIARALDASGRGLLLHAAPTGTGKGAAYLVPGILAALRGHARWRAERAEDPEGAPAEPPKLVVSTANIALQSQLLRKDVPGIAAMLGIQVRAVVLKSVQNYVCRAELNESGARDDLEFSDLLDWLEAPGATGDREDVPGQAPEPWSKVSRGTDDCLRQSCPHYPASSDASVGWCWWRRAIQGWERAHVVITNHHTLAVRPPIRSVLLAIDEMHELEDSIRASVEATVTVGSGSALARKCVPVIGDSALTLIEAPVRRIVQWARDVVERNASQGGRGPRFLDDVALSPGWAPVGSDTAAADIERAAAMVSQIALNSGCYEYQHHRYRGETGNEVTGRLARAATQAWRLAERCRAVVDGEPLDTWPGAREPWAIYASVGEPGRDGQRRATLHMAPADVSWAFQAMARSYRVIAMTSATVPDRATVDLTFGIGSSAATGLDDEPPEWTVVRDLPSPYDLSNQGVLVVPQGPDPKSPAWPEWAAERVVEVVLAAGGRTLVLASSVSQMRRYATALRHAAGGQPWDVRCQGEAGRSELRAWFASNVLGVLVGTRSFFQGLDVQGESCSVVVIDRIPFARPGDVVESAVGAMLVRRAGGGSAYMLRSIPDAAKVLAQGAGRLIRSETDRGAVVLLDNRVLGGGDGWRKIRDALPPFPLSRDVDDVARVLAGETVSAPPPPRGRRRSPTAEDRF